MSAGHVEIEPGARGTGAAFGAKMLRLGGLHSLSLMVANGLTFGALITFANFLEPADFGRLGLLLFGSGLLTLVLTLAVKQGTIRRTFGGDDDDDEEDEDEVAPGVLSQTPGRTISVGLVAIAAVGALSVALAALFADQIALGLLRDHSAGELVIWAAVAGASDAVNKLASILIWLERRPYPYIAVEATRPLLTLAIVIPLLSSGQGLEAAIMGYALAGIVSAIVSVAVLWPSITPTFSIGETLKSYRAGAVRVPIVLSFWTVGYADVFILSKYLDATDLGVYHLASRAGFLVSFFPAAYRVALRPLRRTTTYRALHKEYGFGTARGLQLGYYLLMLVGVLLAITMLARVVVRVAPASYRDAAELIPFLAAGFVAPTTFRMVQKSVQFANKRNWFIGGVVGGALLFIGLTIALVGPLDAKASGIAMILAFLPGMALTVYRSQTGDRPIELPVRPTAIALGLAIAAVGAFELARPPGIVAEAALAVALIVAWAAGVFTLGAVPTHHRAALRDMVRVFSGRVPRFDTRAALAGLQPEQRVALHRAIVLREAPELAAAGFGNPDNPPPKRLVRALRRAAIHCGGEIAWRGSDDIALGLYLFGDGSTAQRDLVQRELVAGTGRERVFEVELLEGLLEDLAVASPEVWSEALGEEAPSDAQSRRHRRRHRRRRR